MYLLQLKETVIIISLHVNSSIQTVFFLRLSWKNYFRQKIKNIASTVHRVHRVHLDQVVKTLSMTPHWLGKINHRFLSDKSRWNGYRLATSWNDLSPLETQPNPSEPWESRRSDVTKPRGYQQETSMRIGEWGFYISIWKDVPRYPYFHEHRYPI